MVDLLKNNGLDIFNDDNNENNDILHIDLRLCQRNGKKCITIVEGLCDSDKYSLKLLKKMRKTFNCSASVIKESNKKIIKLSGDQREKVKNLLIDLEIVEKENIIIHGY